MTVGAIPQASAAIGPLYVMDLASRKANWATVRQAAIAGNIANSNTPGYKARDIDSFVAKSDKTQLQMAATRRDHMTISPTRLSAGDLSRQDGWDMKHSANNVSLDEQLMMADETARDHQLSLQVMGTFHRMLLTSVSFR
ncbi:flagellar basal body protein [Acuticoccus sp. I52.16.1]|uniref:flagellar basal body protein n=1 Tax=Acuticoccus sp. I52.16.1 TaxID=2928472 RepID=UPI001FD2464D|nr:flagellar basal body protein [Acuticoccus sp. I52.16.1]UOM34308.1 flagellar basal body protein [Acuticoccus sp. I52.16.1]